MELHNLTPSHQMDLQVDKEIHQVAREGKKDQDSEEDETEVFKCPHSKNPKHAFLHRPVCPSSIALHQNPFSGLMLPVADRTERAKCEIFVKSKMTRCTTR